jgi:hypothetical protein
VDDTININRSTAAYLMLLLEDLLLDHKWYDTPDKLQRWHDELHDALPEPVDAH